MSAYCGPHCSRYVELQISMSSAIIHGSAEESCMFTCVEASRTESGAGLTRAMSCAAADVMSDVAD